MTLIQEFFGDITKQEALEQLGCTEFDWPDKVEKAIRSYSRRILKQDVGRWTVERLTKELLGWHHSI